MNISGLISVPESTGELKFHSRLRFSTFLTGTLSVSNPTVKETASTPAIQATAACTVKETSSITHNPGNIGTNSQGNNGTYSQGNCFDSQLSREQMYVQSRELLPFPTIKATPI